MEPIAERIKKLVKELDGDDQGAVFKAESTLARLAQHAGGPDHETDRADIAAALATELGAVTTVKERKKTRSRATHSVKARRHLCRCLSFVGGEAEVPMLQKALSDLDVREMGRFALERNASAAATQALVKAVDAIGTDFRIGAINALGKRTGTGIVSTLQALLSDGDAEVQLAAAEALANFPDATSYKLMRTAIQADTPRAQARIDKAGVRLAETLRKAGDKWNAKSLYRLLKHANIGAAQRQAAEIGLNAIPKRKR